MITYLNGKLIEKNPTELVIECGGIGYEVKISLNTFSNMPDTESVKIYTQFIVREDAQILYGFKEKDEREMFNLLTSVSGIGPSTAIIMLSGLNSSEIANAIASEDVITLKGVKGIGTKTAERMIVELKDKMLKFGVSDNISSQSNNTLRFDALTALISLGFDRRKAESAIKKVMKEQDTVEMLIKDAL